MGECVCAVRQKNIYRQFIKLNDTLE